MRCITPGCASPPDAHHPRMRITPECASPPHAHRPRMRITSPDAHHPRSGLVICIPKICGLRGLKHHLVEKMWDTQKCEDRARILQDSQFFLWIPRDEKTNRTRKTMIMTITIKASIVIVGYICVCFIYEVCEYLMKHFVHIYTMVKVGIMIKLCMSIARS